ncbi:MAG: 4-hydroxy-tetrahydrodipicolinate reductase [Acidimicrobiales bacterium]
MLRVGVLGAGGRMGREVCRAVIADPELDLAAAVDPALAGIDLRQVTGTDSGGLQVGSDIGDLERASADVAVDFTVAEAALENLQWCAAHSVHAVVGTTGLVESDVSRLDGLFSRSPANCVLAPNFAIGAALMIRFAELAAPFMDGAEIIELHHAGKVDAPSGTAMSTAERIDVARVESGSAPWPAERTARTVLDGVRGGAAAGGVRVHSVRLNGLVAHQEVIFGAVGQSLTIRHDAYDRTSFMPGVLLAVKAVPGRPGLTLGLGPLLGF